MKQVKIISDTNCRNVEKAFNEFSTENHQILEVQSHVTTEDYTLVVVYEKKGILAKRDSFTLSRGNQKIELRHMQSPRGLRFGDKRADLLIIDCYNSFDSIHLAKHIGWLEDLRLAMTP